MLTVAISFAAGVACTLVVLVALVAVLAYLETRAPVPTSPPPRKRDEYAKQRGPFPLFRKVNSQMEPLE